MSRHMLSVADLSELDLDLVMARAREHRSRRVATTRSNLVVGLLFLETSLRTRTGFAAAAARLGWQPLIIPDRRNGQHGGPPESLRDTVRMLSAYVDVLVLRQSKPVRDLIDVVPQHVALINAGDGGDRAEHPSQAVLDVFAMEELCGPLARLRIVICGDLSMRSARSLLSMLAKRPPRAVTLCSDSQLADQPLGTRTKALHQLEELADADVLYVVGIPHGVPEPVRQRLRVDRRAMGVLPRHGIVLSPMPVIDEIASIVRSDHRIRMFDQSDLGLPVRMALLELLVGELG
jgi:aspartate carbamoyltransferase catalytic subunit